LAGIVAAALVVAAAVSTSASAAAETHCRFSATITLTPGLAVVPSSGTFTTGGQTGVVHCDGPVRGIVPTGPGTLGVDGRYGTEDPDSCLTGGEGDGRFSFTFPTASGVGKRSNTFTFTYGLFNVGGPGAGFSGEGFSGSLDEVSPEEGDCLTRPVTRISLRGHGTITR
jgi:hypothetical protein